MGGELPCDRELTFLLSAAMFAVWQPLPMTPMVMKRKRVVARYSAMIACMHACTIVVNTVLACPAAAAAW